MDWIYWPTPFLNEKNADFNVLVSPFLQAVPVYYYQVTTNAPFCDVHLKGYNTKHGNFTTGESCISQLDGC